MPTTCGCFIIPKNVLDRFAKDKKLSAATRNAFKLTSELETNWRALRAAHGVSSQGLLASSQKVVALAAAPAVTVANCGNSTSLPGTPIPNPKASSDATAKRTFAETTKVAKFYQTCFGRNSVDDLGMTLASSIHYGTKYNNAFWNGSQMTYGDGDQQIFVDFTKSNDVIAHELTHGVTQFTAGLDYTGQAGGLNESMSDCFGSMFRQWEAKQNVTQADWLIGSEIMGPKARARGFTCLRDMADPGAAHCLAPQPKHFKDYVPGSDPHESSGIPNYAFYLAAMAVGGKAWETVGRIWYAALTSPKATPAMTFKAFATLTKAAAKQLFPKRPAVYSAVAAAWKNVGVK